MFDKFSFYPDIDLYYDTDCGEAYDLVDKIANNKKIKVIKFALAMEIPVSKKYSSLDSWADPSGALHSQKIYDTFEQRIIPKADAIDFMEYCKSKELQMVASIYDCSSAKIAGPYCSALKVASTNITNFPLIECICKYSSNLVIDTGNSTNVDIYNVLKFVKKISPQMSIMLQYSPTRPPADSSTWNMWRIKEMQQTFQLPVGLSDHDNTTNQALLSLGLGVLNVEKGIMSDRAWGEGVSDSAHCIPISKLNDYLDTVLTAELGLHHNQQALFSHERAKNTRSGLYAGVDIDAGSVLKKGDIVSLIPQIGIPANEVYDVIGLKVVGKIKKGEPIERKNIRSF